MIGPTRMRQLALKYLNNEVRYRTTPKEVEQVIFDLLTGRQVPEVPSSREDFLLMYTLEAVEDRLQPEEYDEVLYRIINEDPDLPRHIDYCLPRAIAVLEQAEKMGAKVNDKIELLKANKRNPILRQIVMLALDWEFTYGLAGCFDVDLEAKGRPVRNAGTRWRRFVRLLKLCDRTGNPSPEVRNKLRLTLSMCPRMYRKWLYRVTQRNLQIRVGIKTARKVWGHRFIRYYTVPLHHTLPQSSSSSAFSADEGFPTRGRVAPYYSGMRVTITVTSVARGRGVVRNRAGMELPFCAFLVPQAIAILRSGGLKAGVLDGDATTVEGESWYTTGQEGATTEYAKEHMRVHVNDVIPLRSFAAGTGPIRRGDRAVRLIQAATNCKEADAPNLLITVGTTIPSRSPVRTRKWIMRQYNALRSEGYEGLVVYDDSQPYMAGDSTAARKASGMLRIQPDGKLYAKVVSVSSAGAFGLVVETDDGSDLVITTGFTKSVMEECKALGTDLIGRSVEIEHQPKAIAQGRGHFIRLLAPKAT